MPVAAIGAGLGLIGGIGKMVGRAGANSRLRQLERDNPAYKENPEAAKRLGLANTILNARMPGAASMERNIYANQANTIANAQRGATDASQLLAMGGSAQGQTNQAFDNLGIQEAQDYQRRYGNQVGAQEGVIREGDKVFQDQQRRFQDNVGIEGAINENNQNTWGDISRMGFGLSDFAMSGGMGSIFGNKSKGQYGSNNNTNTNTGGYLQNRNFQY